jgi:hypothetical protein
VRRFLLLSTVVLTPACQSEEPRPPSANEVCLSLGDVAKPELCGETFCLVKKQEVSFADDLAGLECKVSCTDENNPTPYPYSGRFTYDDWLNGQSITLTFTGRNQNTDLQAMQDNFEYGHFSFPVQDGSRLGSTISYLNRENTELLGFDGGRLRLRALVKQGDVGESTGAWECTSSSNFGYPKPAICRCDYEGATYDVELEVDLPFHGL